MRRPGEVLSRGQLLEAAWDIGFESRSNIVDVYVRYLREKIDRPFGRIDRDGARRRLPPPQGRQDDRAAPDPRAPDAAVRARDGDCPRRDGLLHRRAGREHASRRRSTRDCAARRSRRHARRARARRRRPRLAPTAVWSVRSCRRTARVRSSTPARPTARSSALSSLARCPQGHRGWRSGSIARAATATGGCSRRPDRAQGRPAAAGDRDARWSSARRDARPPGARVSDWRHSPLLVAILAGYGVAASALRPVEAMRRRAAAIDGVDRRAAATRSRRPATSSPAWRRR